MSSYIIDTGADSIVMVRQDDHGRIIETEFDTVPYSPIPKGIYDLEITGFQAPFEVPRDSRFPKEDWQSDTVTKTRLEFTVLSGEHQGETFLCRYTVSVGERANLGKLLRAITQAPIKRPWDMTTMLGLCFSATVVHAKDQQTGQVRLGRDGNPFPDIVIDTIEPLNTEPLPPELQPTPKKPTPIKPKASAPDEDNDPTLSWSALWKKWGRWGITDNKTAEKHLKMDISQLEPGDIDALLAELTAEKN